MRISFPEFQLGDNCEQDYIKVYQGWQLDSPATGKYCGSQKPPEIQSSTRYMKVNFKGTGVQTTQNQRRFKMYVRKTPHGCGGLLLNNFGTIQTLNYGSRYENNVECVWNIQISVGYHLNFTFVERFDIEFANNCNNDYILFEEQLVSDDENSWSQIGKYCGHDRPLPFKSRTNRVKVTFHSNDNINGDGFKFNYQIACGEIFTAPNGVFTSPNYPNNYDNDIRCEYLIQRNPHDYILLEFNDFHIEEHQTCIWDAVDIYKGNTTSATHFGPYCSADSKPPPMTSLSAMLITFKSDSYVVAKGFKASYSITSCGGNFTEMSGEFQSPLHPDAYLRNMDCVWLITVAENKAVELKFIFMDLEECWRCNCDYVEVRDGNNISSPLIGRYCGLKNIESIIKSVGNQLWVRFRTNRYYQRTGFKAGYRGFIRFFLNI